MVIAEKHILVLAFLLFSGIVNCKAQTIDIAFTNLKTSKGQIVMQVFTDDKSFQSDKELKTFTFKKATVANGVMMARINLEPGTYGFALVDDENANSEMDYNWIGLPKEGFGFSNFYLSGMSRPKFESFKFTVTKDQHVKIIVKLRYL